jgi:hypothetical protein
VQEVEGLLTGQRWDDPHQLRDEVVHEDLGRLETREGLGVAILPGLRVARVDGARISEKGVLVTAHDHCACAGEDRITPVRFLEGHVHRVSEVSDTLVHDSLDEPGRRLVRRPLCRKIQLSGRGSLPA